MATALQIQQLYIAYFGRPADPSGLDYWVSTNISTKDFAAAMYAQPEFLQANQSLPVSEQVNAIYLNLFGRNGDAAGLIYWTQQINTGKLTLASIANDLIFAANNSPASAADKAALVSKTTTAITYTEDVRETTASFLAYNPTSATPWVTGPQFTSAVAFLATATAANIPSSAAVQASVDAMTAITPPGQTFTLTTDQFSYTGTSGNDTFIAGVNNFGFQTLLSADTIVGGGGTNSLTATIIQDVTPAQISNIQNISLTFGAPVIAGSTPNINLINATGVQALTNNGSIVAGIISGLNTTTAISHINTALGLTLNYVGVAGATDTAALTISNVTAGTVVIPNIETLNLTSGGSTTNTLTALTGSAGLTTLNLGGTAGLTITNALANITTVNQPVGGALSGALNLGFTQGAVTATGGAGNDTFTVNGVGNANLSGGNGNDTFIFAGANSFTANDTVSGGSGTNVLTILGGDANVVNANVSGVPTLNVTGAAVNAAVTNISGVSTINLQGAGVYSVIGPAGSLTINTSNLLTGLFTATDTGTGIADVLNINNTNATVGSIFNNGITSKGYETINLNVGAVAANNQTLGTVIITPDTGGTGVLNLGGANTVTAAAITAGTINAAGLSGAATFIMNNVATGASSIIGSGNADILLSSTVAATINGGAGNDTITSAGFGDTILGGAGNDTITAGTGNDSIDAGADNDRVVFASGQLTILDTVSGGDGTDTFAYTTYTQAADNNVAPMSRLSNFEILEMGVTNAAVVPVVLFNYINNTGFTEIRLGAQTTATNGFAFTNAYENLNTISTFSAQSGTHTFTRFNDTATNSLTIRNATAGPGGLSTITAFTAVDEETITIGATVPTTAGANDLTITTLTVGDLTDLVINSASDVTITNAIVGASSLTLVDATASTGNVSVNAGALSGINNASGITMTSNAARTANLSGILGFSSTVFTGTNFNDNITGSGGNDILTGGAGADVITGGVGGDLLTGGTGSDLFVFNVGDSYAGAISAATVVTFASGVDVISDFVGNSDAISPSLTNTGTQAFALSLFNAIYGFGLNASLTGSQLLVNQFTPTSGGTLDAGVKSFYVQGTWNGTNNTFTDTGAGDFMLFQANITGAMATSIQANGTTDLTALFNSAEKLILDNPS